jgi:hypothetical protein
MLKNATRPVLVGLIGLAVLAASMWGATYSRSYRECERNYSEEIRANKNGDLNQRLSFSISDRVGNLLDCEAVFAKENGEAITGIATVFLTLVTGLLVWMAYDQGRTTRAQLRAYVFIKSANCGLMEQTVVARIKFKNFGVTPAYKVAVHFALVPESAIANTKLSPKAEIALGPGSEISISHGKPFDTFIKNGAIDRAHVIGRVEYRDTFDERRTTHFKMRYVTSDTGDGLEPTEDGNNAD